MMACSDVSQIFHDDCCQVSGIDHFWLLYTTSSKIICHDINLVDGDVSSTGIYVKIT